MYQPATAAQRMKYLAADGEKRGRKKGWGVVGGLSGGGAEEEIKRGKK